MERQSAAAPCSMPHGVASVGLLRLFPLPKVDPLVCSAALPCRLTARAGGAPHGAQLPAKQAARRAEHHVGQRGPAGFVWAGWLVRVRQPQDSVRVHCRWCAAQRLRLRSGSACGEAAVACPADLPCSGCCSRKVLQCLLPCLLALLACCLTGCAYMQAAFITCWACVLLGAEPATCICLPCCTGWGGRLCNESFEPVCLNQCNGRGECRTGYCQCHPGKLSAAVALPC